MKQARPRLYEVPPTHAHILIIRELHNCAHSSYERLQCQLVWEMCWCVFVFLDTLNSRNLCTSPFRDDTVHSCPPFFSIFLVFFSLFFRVLYMLYLYKYVYLHHFIFLFEIHNFGHYHITPPQYYSPSNRHILTTFLPFRFFASFPLSYKSVCKDGGITYANRARKKEGTILLTLAHIYYFQFLLS